MIPISDDNPARRPALVNWGLIMACVGFFGWEIWRGLDWAVGAYGFRAASVFGPHAHGVPVTLFTHMFLHGGVLHIAGNMLYLWIFGNNVEDAMGHVRYGLFYLICGVAAALGFAYMAPGMAPGDIGVPMVGASGAISGVLAAYFLLFPRAKVTVAVPLGIIFYPLAVSAVWVIGFWFFMQLLSVWLGDPGQPDTAFWAHVAGFITGLILTPLFKSRDVPLFGHPKPY